MDPVAKNADKKKLISFCVGENNQQNMQMNENGWKKYQYDEILDDNWEDEDLIKSVIVCVMDFVSWVVTLYI